MTDIAGITEKIRGFVENRIGRPVADDENYFETGSVSSMFGLQIITYIEQEFGLVVADDDLSLENFDTIAHLSTFISGKR
jgi:acyl carrier protein